MVFVTVGTTGFPFDRLLERVDRALINSNSKEELVVQKGASSYEFKYQRVKVFEEFPFDKMISYLKKARVVVTHGGPATIFLALKYGKNKPLVVPRYKDAGEHVNNHQEFFVKGLERGLVKMISSQEDFMSELNRYLKHPEPVVNKNCSEMLNNLIQKLINYTESIQTK